MESDVIVTVCTPEEWVSARSLLLRHAARQKRARFSFDSVNAGANAADVLTATENGQLLGAIVHQLGRGRVGWLWAPALTIEPTAGGPQIETASRLIRAAVHRLAGRGARLVQALLPPGHWCAKTLESCDFRLITQIVQMARDVNDECRRFPSRADIEFVPFCSAFERPLHQLVEQSYQDTFDFPELDGVRPVEEVMEGYRAAGEFREAHWSLARRAHQFVGCVLLGNFPETKTAVLQYIGVIPAHRRRGIGRELIMHGLRVACDADAERMILAVDTRNIIARRLYWQSGFHETERRAVFIREISHGGR